MKFCTNCGKELGDDAVFCTGCGASTGSASGTNTLNDSTAVPGQHVSSGAYQQPGPQATPSIGYYQPSPQGTPSGYYQAGPQAGQGTGYQPGVPGGQNTPYYPNNQYNSGGPYYPGGGSGKNNKMLIIIVSVIVGLCMIGGGIFAIARLTNRDNSSISDSNTEDDDSDIIASDNSNDDIIAKPTEDSEPADTGSSVDSTNEELSIFDAVTRDNLIAACEDAGMDVSKITDVLTYGTWLEGDAYTFTYDNDSIIDVLLYDDGTVYSLETGGVQVYLTGYKSYSIDDYIGYTTHFDESYPDNGYAFYLNGSDVDSTVNIETGSDYDYVIELVDANDGSLASAFYVRSGTTWTMDVPTGDYYIQYAAGVDWSGVDYLFGDDTLFFKSDSIYSLNPENESTITLDITGGTGIPSSAITLDDF